MKVLNRDSLSIVKIFASILIVGCMLNRADVSSAQAPFRVNNDTKSDMETYLERKRAQQEVPLVSVGNILGARQKLNRERRRVPTL